MSLNVMEPTRGRGSGISAASAAEEAELELGLGLSVGGAGERERLSSGSSRAKLISAPPRLEPRGRILTAHDFPSSVGTKRTADESVSQEGGSPTSASPVVGWPPIRSYRMNSLVNLAKAPRAEDDKPVNEKDKLKDGPENKLNNGSTAKFCSGEQKHIGFVKVNMDGIPIGRKVDLNAHTCYETLAQTLEDMFFQSGQTVDPNGIGEKACSKKSSKLLDGSSDFVLTYEDRDGDWMLVGDVPWGMFLTAVKRLRIMRTSEVNGLGPRSPQQRSERQSRKPI